MYSLLKQEPEFLIREIVRGLGVLAKILRKATRKILSLQAVRIVVLHPTGISAWTIN